MTERIALWVKTKSRAVIGTPSLHLASGRMWYVSVKGGVRVTSTRDTRSGSYDVESWPMLKAPRSERLARMRTHGTLEPHLSR
jgi:hypothetical protein